MEPRNGASPLTLPEFMELTAPRRITDDTDLFARVEEYGQHIGRLQTAAEREMGGGVVLEDVDPHETGLWRWPSQP